MSIFVSSVVRLPPEEWVQCPHCKGAGCDHEHCDDGVIRTATRRVSEAAERAARKARGRGED